MTSASTLCCNSPDVMNSDHVQDGVKTVNRVCLVCYTHWHGLLGEVKKFSRTEWDAHLDRKLQNLEKELFV